MIDYAALKAKETARWEQMRITDRLLPVFLHTAQHLLDAKGRYRVVESLTKVPWFIIAVIHNREASQSWSANLAQGDPWNKPSIHVPRGRGPFHSWEEAAVDALTNCAPHTARNTDWSIGGALVALEAYNGFGYEFTHHIPSPYLWAGTDQYIKGKYIVDGHFDPEAIDRQLGCAGMLRALMKLDPTIEFPHAT